MIAPRATGLIPADQINAPAAATDDDGAAPARDAIDDPAADPAAGGSGRARASAGSPGRQVVDTRVTDAGDIKITVIAYNDGSTETLTQVKRAGITLGDKGMMVDRSA